MYACILVDMNEWIYQTKYGITVESNNLEPFTSQSFNHIFQEEKITDNYASLNPAYVIMLDAAVSCIRDPQQR